MKQNKKYIKTNFSRILLFKDFAKILLADTLPLTVPRETVGISLADLLG